MRHPGRLPLLSLPLLCGIAAHASGIAVSGRVLGPGRSPVAGADVELTPLLGETGDLRALLEPALAEPVARGRTNAGGRFRVEAPGVGLWRVRVSAEGFVPLVADVTPLFEPVELVDAEFRADSGLSVLITDRSGHPLAGATALLSADRRARTFRRDSPWQTPPRFGTADDQGKLHLPKSDFEKVWLSGWAPGHASTGKRGVRGTAARLELPAAPTSVVEVVSDAGAAEPGVLVALGDDAHPVGFTDERGRLAVAIEAGSATNLLLAARDGRSLETHVDVPPPAPPQEAGGEPPEDRGPAVRRFRLPGRVEVAGKVIDGDTRRGVAGALAWEVEHPDRAAATDDGGRFTLSARAGAELRLTCGAAGYMEAQGAKFLPAGGRPGPTLVLRRTASIEGVVRDANGEPVAGADLGLAAKRTPMFGGRSLRRLLDQGGVRGVSHDDGTFRLAEVDPEGIWLVRARAEGFAPAEVPAGSLEPGRATTGVEITLTSGLTIAGTLVDASGAPVAGADVTLERSTKQGAYRFASRGDDPIGVATSDATGRFSIANLSAGTFDLEARRTGFAPRRMSTIEIDEDAGPLDLGEIRLDPGETLSGYVTDGEGLPVEGVEVRTGGGATWSTWFGGPEPGPDAVTDAAGAFRLGDLAAGERYTLSLERTGYVRKSVRAVEAPREEPLRVEIEPASEVRGTVADRDGRPVADATVWLLRARGSGFGRGGPRERFIGRDRTDDEGRFVVEGISPGEAALVADAPGYRKGRLDDVAVPAGEDVEGLELRLDRGAVLEGQVQDPDGRPVIGAVVGEVPDENATVRFGSPQTDGDGRYRLDGLTPGQVSIQASHENYPRLVRDVEVRAGTTRLDLRFEGGLEVRGRVVDAVGRPVADAWVRLVPAGRGWGGPGARSEGDGGFLIPGVRDGDYELRTMADGYAAAEGPPVRVEGRSVEGLEVRLDAGATLRGTIGGLDAEGAGRVTVRASTASFRGSRYGGVDYRGSYHIDNLEPGDYRVVATEGTGRQARGSVTIEPGAPSATLDLEFEPGLVLTGRAVRGEEPVAGVSVSARGIDVGVGNSTLTDPDGAFRIEGLVAGSYGVAVHDWRTGLSHEETVDLETSREIVLRVPTGTIAGAVSDASDDAPLSGVAVVAERETAAGGLVMVSATTDSAGRFEIRNLSDGAWRLTASKKGYAARTQSVTVEAAAADGVDVALSPTEGLTLGVRLASGAVPDWVYVAVLDGTGAALVGGDYATGEGGRVRVSSVPPGAWELLVAAPGSATTSLGVTAPGPPVAIELPPAGRLIVRLPALDETTVATVRLRDPGGRPFRDVAWTGQTRTEWRVTAGRLELSSLPPSVWTVTVTTPDGRSWHGQATTTAGATAELVLD